MIMVVRRKREEAERKERERAAKAKKERRCMECDKKVNECPTIIGQIWTILRSDWPMHGVQKVFLVVRFFNSIKKFKYT